MPAEIIGPDRVSSAAGPGLSYWLGQKLLGVPLMMPERHGELLREAIESGAFDAKGAGPAASKFIGTFDARSRFRVTADGIALVAIQGLLLDRGPWLGDLYGFATSYEGLAEQFQRLAQDPAIKHVVLDIDSPGGMVSGIYDLTEELKKLKKEKPVTALAANMAVSAAYAVACCADEVFVTRTGEAGMIGVIVVHRSVARALDQMGVDTTIICEPADKAAGHPSQQLTHGARAEISQSVSDAYQRFVSHVAAARSMADDAVRALTARIYIGDKAVEAGLVDGVKSIEEVLDHIRKQSKAARPPPARKAARGPAARKGGAPVATDDLPDEGTNYAAVMADAVRALAAGHTAMASKISTPPPATTAVAAEAPVQPAAAAPAAAAPTDAKARVKAILDCAAAKPRPGLARYLALEIDIDAAEAEKILGAAPEEGRPNAASNFYKAVAVTGGNPQVAHAVADGAQPTRAQSNIERQKARLAKAGR